MTATAIRSGKRDFKLGADPEFGFVDPGNNSMISAWRVMDDVSHNKEFGLDGSRVVAELRPKPHESPIKLVANIKEALLSRRSEKLPAYDYKWKAGSFVGDQPIGGHIHFGVKSFVYNQDLFVESLGTYLGATAVLVESPSEAKKRRTGTDYGKLFDWRDQPHGIEYRACSSWLTSPYIAAGILSLAKVVAWEYLHNALSGRCKTYPEGDGLNTLAKHFKQGNFNKLKSFFLNITWPHIQAFELYPRYKKSIDLIHHLISKDKTWFPGGRDMRAAWGIKTERFDRMSNFGFEDIWGSVRGTEGVSL